MLKYIIFLLLASTCVNAASVSVFPYPYSDATELSIGQQMNITIGDFGAWRHGIKGCSGVTIQTAEKLYLFDNLPQPFLVSVVGNPYENITIQGVPEPASCIYFIGVICVNQIYKRRNQRPA